MEFEKNKDLNSKHSTLSSFLLNNKGLPHVVIELSKKEHNDMKHNSIHLSGIKIQDKCISYDNIGNPGKSVNSTIKNTNIDGTDVSLRRINITKSKKRLFCLTTTSSEILQLRPSTVILKSTSRYNSRHNCKQDGGSSGIVLLYLAIAPASKTNYDMDMGSKFASLIKRTKPNIMKKGAANHHNSTGCYYSLGNKGAFHREGNSSVGQYSKTNITVKMIETYS